MGNKDVNRAPPSEYNIFTVARIRQPSWQLITRDSTRQSAGYRTWVVTTPCTAPGLGENSWKAAWRKKTWGCRLRGATHQACAPDPSTAPPPFSGHALSPQIFLEMPLVLVLTPYLASQHAIVNRLILFRPFSCTFLIGWHLEFNKELFFFILPDTNYKAPYRISTAVILPPHQGKKES